MLSNILKLAWGFGKAGLFGYGGGVGIVEILKNVAVKNEWLTEQEFADAVTVSYSLPGPVATQLAGVIGWKVAGFFGAVTAIIAAFLPSLLLMFALYGLFVAKGESPIIKGVMNGIRPAVFAIIALLALEFSKSAGASWITALLSALTFVLLYYFKINPAFAVIACGVVGGFFLR